MKARSESSDPLFYTNDGVLRSVLPVPVLGHCVRPSDHISLQSKIKDYFSDFDGSLQASVSAYICQFP